MIGAHVSIAGGVENAPENGRKLRCEAVQIFTRNQRQWTAPPLGEEGARSFRLALEKAGIRGAIAHASYLFNMAGDGATLRRSREGLRDEWNRAEALGLSGLVLHPGSHLGRGELEGIDRIIDSLDAVEGRRPAGRTRLLLETTAGQGSNLGYRFEQIAAILAGVRHGERFGACLDTAHVFAAGYDIRTAEGLQAVLEEFDRVIGLDRLGAFHLNDSKAPLGSRIDRHEHIGKGKIGRDPFRVLVNEPRFRDLPMVLETPGGEDHYRKNLAALRRLMAPRKASS